METTNSVIQRRHYGQIRLKLKEQLDMRGMKRNTLARICLVLGCGVEGLLEYRPGGAKETDPQ